jgi:hypothetical protein
MKGYMLKLSTAPIQAGTDVTWSIKKGDQETGTYHPGGVWEHYDDVLPPDQRPKTRSIYWRSDTVGSIDDSYTIEAQYTPPNANATTRVSRVIRSRLLDPNNAGHRDQFNEDADMVQRALIQVFYLDKGRLTSYRIGKYDKGDSANPDGPHGFYRVDRTPPKINKWSCVADEVSNFDKFALNSTVPDARLQLRIVQGIWAQFDLILGAPLLEEVTTQDALFDNNWVPGACQDSGYTMPEGFGANREPTLKAQVQQEGGRHSYNRFDPLAVSNLQIGENAFGEGAAEHVYTDGGLGFGKIQPYNRGTHNVYMPYENLVCMAEIMKGNVESARNPGTNADEKVWRALFKYNNGPYRDETRIGDLRNSQDTNIKRSANYADGVFAKLGLQPPP